MEQFGQPLGIPENEGLGGGLGSSAFGGGYRVDSGNLSESPSQDCYIEGAVLETISDNTPAFIVNVPVGVSSETSCFMYGAGYAEDCNTFDEDPNIQETDPDPYYQEQTWNEAQSRIDWELRREYQAGGGGGHYWDAPIYVGATPYMELEWHLSFSDLQKFSAYGRAIMFGNSSLVGEASHTGGFTDAFISLNYDWDTDRVASRSVRGEFFNGTDTYYTSYVTVATGNTYDIKVWIDPSTDEGVLDVDGTEYRVDIDDASTFYGTYSQFYIPSSGGTATEQGADYSYATGWMDSLCVQANAPAVFTSIGAFIDVTPYSDGFQGCYLLAPEPIEESQDSLVVGHESLEGSTNAYIHVIVGTESGTEELFVHGNEPSTGSQLAYIRTPEPISDTQPQFIHGNQPLVGGQSAYLHIIVGTEEDSNTAFIYGIAKEHFSHPSYVHIETPISSGKPSYVHIETPITSSKGVTVVASEIETGSVPAYFHGWDIELGSQPSFVQIETPVTVTQGAFVNGPPIEGFKDSFIAAPWRQLAFIQIETPITESKNAFINGDLPISSYKPTYMGAHYEITDSQNAFIQIITPRQVKQECYVSGPSQALDSQGAYIDGINQDEVSHDAYLYGHFVTPPSNLGAYVHIEEFEDAFQSAFIKVGEPVPTFKPAWINGLLTLHAQVKNCFIDSRERIDDFQAAYVHIQTPISDSHNAFVQIENPINANLKRAYIRNVGELQQPQNCFILGGFRETEVQLAYIHIHTPFNAPAKMCHIRNQPEVYSSVGCYIFETGLGQVAQPSYIQTEYIGETSVTKKAYIDGKNSVNIIVSETEVDEEGNWLPERPLYISGHVVPLSKFKNCFIVSYGLIGEWDLDDGEFDSNNSQVDDTSTVDNDGSTVNFPSWVGGPHGDEC